jgi:glycosyltransferase involved in cell wall biosynthesis
MKLPFVSVIVTTKNSAKTLYNCFESIKFQTYPKIEIILVDNHSTDNTLKIAHFYTSRIFSGNERSAQRNIGIKKSKGDYLLFLDSDMILSKKVIEEGVHKLLKNKKLVGLYIPEIIIGHTFWTKVRNFERSFYNQTVIDCVRLVKKNEVLQINGFDESLYSAEDWDFQKRLQLKGTLDSISSPLYHDENNFSLTNYLSKKTYYIKGLDVYKHKWGSTDPHVKKQFSFIYRYFIVFIEESKWKKIIIHPVLTIGMYLLRIFVGFQYLVTQNEKNKFNSI